MNCHFLSNIFRSTLSVMFCINTEWDKSRHEDERNLPKKKVGILFGSFNPPHLGHIGMAKQAKEAKGLDEVWLVPNKQAMSKSNTPQISHAEKVELCEMMAEECSPWLKVSSALANQSSNRNENISSYYNAIADIDEMSPHSKIYLLAGTDNGSKVIDTSLIAISIETIGFGFARDFYSEISKPVARRLTKMTSCVLPLEVDRANDNFSSSHIRDCLQNGKSEEIVALPPRMIEYIKHRGFYLS